MHKTISNLQNYNTHAAQQPLELETQLMCPVGDFLCVELLADYLLHGEVE